MSTEARFWQALSILATLLTAVLPVYFAYNLFTKGSTPPKQISLTQFPTNPMEDLSVLGQDVSLSLRIADQTIDNIAIVRAFLTNIGTAPILRTDYDQNITITVQKPWKIVAVENGIGNLLDTSNGPRNPVEFRWKRISDTMFEAEPVLLNPNDQIATNIYLTNTAFVNTGPIHGSRVSSMVTGRTRLIRAVPDIEWKVRIANLPGSIIPSNTSPYSTGNPNSFLFVILRDWALIFTIVAAMLFQALYLQILHRQEILSILYAKDVFLIIGTSFLSFAAAESISSYVFDTYAFLSGYVKFWYNAPWIILHVAFLLLLFRKVRPNAKQQAP